MPRRSTVVMVAPHQFQDSGDLDNGKRELCEKCGKEYGVGASPWCPHEGGGALTEKTYPFTTKNFNGQPIEVTSRAHEKALQQQYGVVKRDDVAWVEKEFIGHNWRTGKPEYREGSGAGLPGAWV